MSGAAIIPKISKISPAVWRVLGCNPSFMTLQGTNTYIVGTGKSRVLIDTGDGGTPEYITSLAEVLEKNKVSLDKIIVTHWHHDHIGGVSDVCSRFNPGCQVLKHPRLGEPEEDDVRDLPVPVTPLQDGERILTEGASLRVIHTPGHTTDHVVLHLEEENAIFSGDCILGEGTTVFEDLYDYMVSLKKILDINPGVIYPGHGNIVEDPEERIRYYIAHRTHRENQILEALEGVGDSPVFADEIVRIVYKDTPEHLYPAAEVNVNHHLEKLRKERKVTYDNSGWRHIKLSNL